MIRKTETMPKIAKTETAGSKKLSKGERLNWTPIDKVQPIVLQDSISKTTMLKGAFVKTENKASKQAINVIIP